MKRDGKEGWVTLKGNQGTSYIEETEKHMVCKRAVAMQGRLASDSNVVRELEEGEVFEMADGPKVESKAGNKRVRGRNLGDSKEGWFTLTTSNMKPWSPQ